MFVVPIQTYILIYKKIYEHWGIAGTLVNTYGCSEEYRVKADTFHARVVQKGQIRVK